MSSDRAADLIAAWVRWEASPRAEWTARAKYDAIHALGLDPVRTAETVAAHRRAGMSIPDAVQTVVNDQEAA